MLHHLGKVAKGAEKGGRDAHDKAQAQRALSKEEQAYSSSINTAKQKVQTSLATIKQHNDDINKMASEADADYKAAAEALSALPNLSASDVKEKLEKAHGALLNIKAAQAEINKSTKEADEVEAQFLGLSNLTADNVRTAEKLALGVSVVAGNLKNWLDIGNHNVRVFKAHIAFEVSDSRLTTYNTGIASGAHSIEATQTQIAQAAITCVAPTAAQKLEEARKELAAASAALANLKDAVRLYQPQFDIIKTSAPIITSITPDKCTEKATVDRSVAEISKIGFAKLNIESLIAGIQLNLKNLNEALARVDRCVAEAPTLQQQHEDSQASQAQLAQAAQLNAGLQQQLLAAQAELAQQTALAQQAQAAQAQLQAITHIVQPSGMQAQMVAHIAPSGPEADSDDEDAELVHVTTSGRSSPTVH